FGVAGTQSLEFAPASHQFRGLAITSKGIVVTGGNQRRDNQAFLEVARVTNDELPPSTVAGNVYVDANNNGQQDAGDSGKAGIVAFLDANSNGKLDVGEHSATTDSAGNYTLSNVGPGNYRLLFVLPSGYSPHDLNLASQDIHLPSAGQ